MAKLSGAGFLFGAVTLFVCALALFDPRFRRACWGLLCKLRGD